MVLTLSGFLKFVICPWTLENDPEVENTMVAMLVEKTQFAVIDKDLQVEVVEKETSEGKVKVKMSPLTMVLVERKN